MQLPEGIETIPSPAILLDPQTIEANIGKMLAMVDGDSSRLRPHVKTHKTPEIIRMQVEAGITQFKCATLSEARMTALGGGKDILLAYQPVGPNINAFLALQNEFEDVRFSAIVDCPEIIALFEATGRQANLFVDIDCGMHRTGIPPGDQAFQLCQTLQRSQNLNFAGLHIYDGHIHEADLAERTAAHEKSKATWQPFLETLREAKIPVKTIVAGGSPTFPHHTKLPVQCSPGTTVLWDAGYGEAHPDMDFGPAAFLLCRVISKPAEDLICIDLGYKAVASERPLAIRATFPSYPELVPVSQSEEHLVLKAPDTITFQIGDAILSIPLHICPTMALHQFAYIIRQGRFTGERWEITARNR